MEIYLLRHGKTQLTIERRYAGRTDTDLCEEGIAEIKSKMIDLHPEVVYVSPLKRAKQTAAIWFPDAEQIAIDDLREMDFGKFEGRTSDEMKDDPDYQKWTENNGLESCPDGEGLETFMPRTDAAFREIINDAKKKKIKDCVIVTHGGVVMSIMSAFMGEHKPPYEWFVKPCGGWHCRLTGGQKSPVLKKPQPINLAEE